MNSPREVNPDPRRALPPVDELVRAVGRARPDLPPWAVTEGARRAVAAAREQLREEPSGGSAPLPDLPGRAAAIADLLAAPHPRRVVNATGIALHTNLGRAPLAPGALAAAAGAAGYSSLELDLATGGRGDRTRAVVEKLVLLSGAGGALAVNNNAAAVMLVLSALAGGREAIVSRGELVEIGGSFRVPEIVSAAGVRLVEVGTTNRTHPGDYEAAIGPGTGLLLKVHRSNFEMRGFVAGVSLPELVRIGAARGLPVVEDLGSALLVDLPGLPPEAWAVRGLRAGADVVCFSADKLLGGPQAGIVLTAEAELARRLRRHPLARAVRLDKLGLAALDWTLDAHLRGRATEEIPLLRMLLAPLERLEARARALAERLAKLAPERVSVERDRVGVGGGSLPGLELETRVVCVRVPEGAERAAAHLRRATPPVVARVRDGCVLLDVRTLLEDDEAAAEAAVATLFDRS